MATGFGFLVALAVAIVLVLLALVAQEVAQRSGAVERDRLQEERVVAEIGAWPNWKKVAVAMSATKTPEPGSSGLLPRRVEPKLSPPPDLRVGVGQRHGR